MISETETICRESGKSLGFYIWGVRRKPRANRPLVIFFFFCYTKGISQDLGFFIGFIKFRGLIKGTCNKISTLGMIGGSACAK